MKMLTLLITLLFINSICQASKELTKKEPHQLSYNHYVLQYGADDTCLAIIDIFFDKRENLGSGQMSLLPVSAGVAIIVPPIGIGLMAISVPLFVNGMFTKNKYNNKKLLQTLMAYQEEQIISKKMRKKIRRSINSKFDDDGFNSQLVHQFKD